jgi:hypothetical protein
MRANKKVFLFVFILALMIALSSTPALASEPVIFGAKTLQTELFSVTPEKSLLINDLSVVEDPTRTFNACTGVGTPMGDWTFGHLMTEMANEAETGISPERFVFEWLRTWGRDQEVNGQTVLARFNMFSAILRPWQEASGGPREPLDLSIAPFRLLAIVNRVDLNDDLDFGGTGAGEARFVFGVVDIQNNCRPMQFTVIFEYQIPSNSCEEIQSWAMQWHQLENFEMGSSEYNDTLEAITDQFVTAGANPDMLPNKSAISAVLTNEVQIANRLRLDDWEFRGFRPASSGPDMGMLKMIPLKQTPMDSFNRTSTLVDYINANEDDILARNYTVPQVLSDGTPFLGGAPTMRPSTSWESPLRETFNSNEARHIFSLNTCNGCHAAETGTLFTHIRPERFGVAASLSGFLTGIDVVDPEDRVTVRTFSELERRQLEVESILNTSCSP